jgi:ribosome-binding factor A
MAQYRAERLSHEIQHFLAQMLRTELRDPRVQMASITRVEVSHDLRHAKVYVGALRTEEREQAARALQHARGLLRSRLAAHLDLRTTPDLQFAPDTAVAGGDQVLGILRRLEGERASEGGE